MPTPAHAPPESLLQLGVKPELHHLSHAPFRTVGYRSYCLPELWAVHIYYYSFELKIDGYPWRIRPGSISLTPAGQRSEYVFPEGAIHACAHFKVPRATQNTGSRMPVVFHPGQEQRDFQQDFARILDARQHSLQHAEVRLWDLLLRIRYWYEKALNTEGQLHPALSSTLATIENEPPQTLSLPELAAAVDLSPVHLNRLFKRHFGQTPIALAKEKQLQHARHLLLHTTHPIKFIANEVGMPDLQAFNKWVRKHLGTSPSELRKLQQ